MKHYNHKKIEKKWQKEWNKKKSYIVKDKVKGKKNEYILTEFAYPSGNLHVGHWYAFAVPDIYARFRRAQGRNVLYPVGFDAFGLPAENAAIKNKLNPRTWTYANIKHMKSQLTSMGASFDWSREVITCDPDYYRWTQWQFLQFYKKGLAYQKETPANWCPNDKTVLANEQIINGRCERCGAEVEQRTMLQWNLKITEYADRLIDDLDTLDWPEQIKEAQRNWIGRSEGAEIDFQIAGTNEKITVFTTRADTIYGVTYLVLAPEHAMVEQIKQRATNKHEIDAYITKTKKKRELERQENKEKTGVLLAGVSAIHPATQENIPVYIADYVLGNYGTGAVMAVPAHDERDFEFAKKFGVPIRKVVTSDGVLTNSDKYDGMSVMEARKAITEVFGRAKKTYRLRDWGVSRQRYWGVPIPIIHCDNCGAVPVPDHDLPVHLPKVTDYLPTGDGKSPLAKAVQWVNVKCPTCKRKAKRETDTLDTFVDSSWYFLRYLDPKNKRKFADAKKMQIWMPIDLYSGGAEHTTMHLLYSRFWHKALYDLSLVHEKEPYIRRMNRGLILGPDGQKMSKSKGNVIDPDAVVAQLGADTVRLYLAFIGPYNEPGSYPWNPDSIIGVRRFLERVWRLGQLIQTQTPTSKSDALRERKATSFGSNPDVERALHQTIKKVGEDCAELKFNTAIAQMMILVNIAEQKGITRKQYATFIRILAPFAPHITEELWHDMGNKKSVHTEPWPTFNKKKLVADTITIAVQINGKTRGEVRVPADTRKEEQEKAARDAVANRLKDQTIIRTIVIPGRLVNFVLQA
jgi:leucyl-tRNA synthetase